MAGKIGSHRIGGGFEQRILTNGDVTAKAGDASSIWIII